MGLGLFGTSAARGPSSRQAVSSPSSTALAPLEPSTFLQAFPRFLLSASQSLVGSPLRLLRQLLAELVTFLRSHRFMEIYNINFWRTVAARLPARVSTYWSTLIAMESQCAQRTICDLANLASTRLPKWSQQIALVYLNTFAETHPYYTVAIHGLTAQTCSPLYAECDADAFLARVRGNVSESIEATVAPLRDALNQLATVASVTINSLATDEEVQGEQAENTNEDEGATLRRPAATRNNQDGHLPNFEDEEEEMFAPQPKQHLQFNPQAQQQFNPRPLPMNRPAHMGPNHVPVGHNFPRH